MTKIIGIVQAKGGAGRSTLATNLAASLSASHRVALVDCDLPQGTSSSWFAARQAEVPADNLVLAAVRTHVELVREVERLASSCRFVVVDAPPRAAELTRAILMLANLCLVPLGASAAEVWATQDLLSVVHEARKRRPGLDARLVWTRFRANTREARELSDAAPRELDLPELRARLGYRVAYSEALGRGLSAEEWLDGTAADEVRALVAEVRGLLREKAA